MNGMLWAIFHSSPLLLGLGMQWFFDKAATNSTNYLWIAVPIIAIAAVCFTRVGVFFAAFYKRVTCSYHIQALLRTNMLAGIMRWLGRNLPASPGEVMTRFRDDVDEVVEYVQFWTDF